MCNMYVRMYECTLLFSHASNDTVLKMIPSFQEVQSMMGIYLLQYLNHRYIDK